MAARRERPPAGYTSRAITRQPAALIAAPRRPIRCGGLQSVTSRPKSRCQRSSTGAARMVTAMPHAAIGQEMRRNPERVAPDQDMPLDVPLHAPARDELGDEERPECRAPDGQGLGLRADERVERELGRANAHVGRYLTAGAGGSTETTLMSK